MPNTGCPLIVIKKKNPNQIPREKESKIQLSCRWKYNNVKHEGIKISNQCLTTFELKR